jgi:two-component system, chemotaxis family, chemotaxis protein CheY
LPPIVLVVDDDDAYRGAVSRLITGAGYRVLQAAHGEDALRLLQSGTRPALIVVDDRMPVMSGHEFVEHVNADPRWRSIPIVFVAASPREYANLENVGPRIAIRKPTDPDALMEAIALLVGHE